jgi:hypothetical protein
VHLPDRSQLSKSNQTSRSNRESDLHQVRLVLKNVPRENRKKTAKPRKNPVTRPVRAVHGLYFFKKELLFFYKKKDKSNSLCDSAG